MHRTPGEIFVADPRFTKTYEDMAPGLADWIEDAWGAKPRAPEG